MFFFELWLPLAARQAQECQWKWFPVKIKEQVSYLYPLYLYRCICERYLNYFFEAGVAGKGL
jgi:hypothetical protein